MAFGPAYGTTGGSGGAIEVFIKKNGDPAIFSDTTARDTYFNANSDEKQKIATLKQAAAIGSADDITAAYILENLKWVPIATNFKGDKGDQGPAGTGVDPSVLDDGGLPKWDSSSQKFISSGLTSTESGEIKMAPNSLHFGHHKMSSSVADVTFTNVDQGEHYSFVFQTMKPGDKDAFIREISPTVDEVVRVAGKDSDVTNPENTVTIDSDEVFYGGTFELAQDTQAVLLEMYDTANPSELIWREDIGDLAAGEQDIVFSVPFKCKAGFKYTMKLKSSTGDLIAKGTGTNFAWKIRRAKMFTKKVAKEEWVNSLERVKDIEASGGNLVVTLEDDSKKQLPISTSGTSNNINTVVFTSDITPDTSTFLDRTPVFIFTGSTQAEVGLLSLDDVPSGQNIEVLVSNHATQDVGVIVSAANSDVIDTANIQTITLPRGYSILFVSDAASNKWHTVKLETVGSGPSTTYVTNVSTAGNGKDITIYYSNNTNVTISLDGYIADITKLDDAVTQLQRKIQAKTKFFSYKGSTVPKLPKGNRAGYYLTMFGITQNLDMTTPTTASTPSEGTVFFIDNASPTYSITLTSGNPGETIAGGTSFNIPGDTVAWFVYNSGNWQELFSGYLPISYKHLLNEIKTSMVSDDSLLPYVQVQGDDDNTVINSKSIKFIGSTVAADSTDASKALVTIDPLTIINPDGTEFSDVEKVKLVGMELKPDPSGIHKLYVLDNQNLPKPVDTNAHAIFSTSTVVPDVMDFSTLPVFKGGRVTVHKNNDDAEFVYIFLPPGQGTDTERVGELGGLPAIWTKSTKDYNINGNIETYTVLKSPYAFHERDLTLVLYP